MTNSNKPKQRLTYIGRSRIMKAKYKKTDNPKQEGTNVRAAEKRSL